MSEKKIVRRNVAVALGIICIVLVAGLVVAFAYYMPIINDKDNTISSLNVEISQLHSTIDSLEANVTYLQDQLKLLNVTAIPIETITSNPSAWVDRIVIVEGSLDVAFFPALEYAPWSYQLSSESQTIGVALSANVNASAILWNQVGYHISASVRICGVVEKGEITYTGQAGGDVTYYIVALTVKSL